MELKCILFLWVVIFHETLATGKFSSEIFSQLLSEVKTELAKSYIKRDLTDKGGSKVINFTHSNLEELILSNPSENGRIFRNANENFLYNGEEVLQLHMNNKSSVKRYSLSAVDDIRLDEGAVFFKNAEWKSKIFLAVCYQRGYCEIRMTAPPLKVHLKIRIDTGTLPLDVTFFGTDEDLFLIAVQDPVIIYRWMGTYFNEENHLDTTGAQSVAAFQDGDKSIITVGQNLGGSKVYSKVYIRKNDKIELFQLLPTSQALRILPFELSQGGENFRFVFVLNNVVPSAIFWWTGKEFILWKSLENIFGSRIIYVGKIQSELFFFISDKNKIYVYHPTVTSFDLMQIITFDQEVVGIDLRHEKDEMPMLVLLTGSASDPYFKVNLILLQVNYITDSEKENKSSGGVLQCLSSVQEKLIERKIKLDRLYRKLTKEKAPFVSNLELTPLEESVREMRGKVGKVQERLEYLRNESEAVLGKSRRYHVYGDLKIEKMAADRIDVELLNGEIVNFENFLSLTKDQVIEGELTLKTLSADVLSAPSINGVTAENLLLRNKKTQRITGEFTVASITAKDIEFGPSASLNQIPAADLVTPHNSHIPINDKKIIRKLKVKNVEVEKINNVSSEDWLAKILPSLKNQNEEEALNFTELTVQKLWVSNLNGIPWNDFVNSVWLPLNNETIKGNLKTSGKVKVGKLKTKKLNGVPVEKLQRTSQKSKCAKKISKKPKSLPMIFSTKWDDSFLKEILNQPGVQYDDEVKYFSGTQKIEGDLRASHVFVKNSMELSETHVGNLEDFKTRYWLKNQDQVISVPIEFKNGLTIKNSILTSTVNNKTISSFVWTDRFNLIPANLIFEDAIIKGNVELADDVVQNVNLKELNENSVKTMGENIISGRKTFLGNVTVENLHVDVLNELDIKDFMGAMKDTLEDSDNIEVSELTIFGDLEVKNGVEVKRINDVDFNETISKALTWDDPEVFKKARFRSLSVSQLDVNTINGLNIEDKLPKLSKSQNKDVYVVIEGNFEVLELNAIKVNGINFSKYINQVVQKNETQTIIRGEKIFKKMVTVTGDLQGNLNEYSIKNLEKIALSKSKPQVITGVYTMEEFQANDVEAEVVEGIPADEILYQDATSTQVINSDIVFNNLAVIGDIQAANFMNNCDLKKVYGVNARNFDEFENLEIRGDINWDSSRENIKGLSHFLSNVVTKSGDQIITGPVEFENDVVMGNVEGEEHFNGVDLEFISKDAIFQSLEEQEILTPVTFKGAVKAKSIVVLDNVLIDSINGVDITGLAEKLVRKSTNDVVRGKKTFTRGFSANYFEADAINDAKINSIVFYDDLAEGKEIRLPPTTFKALKVFNDLKVIRINGDTFDSIISSRLLKTKNQTVSGKIVVEGNVKIIGDGNIQRINDVNMEDTILADEKVSAKVITGDIEFRDTISIADKLEVDYINGQNITALLEKALMVDEDAMIEGDVEFDSDVTINGNIDVKGVVNNCDLKKVIQMDFTDGPDDSTNLRVRESLRREVEELTNLTKTFDKPLVFMYLKEMAQFDIHLPTIHATAANKRDNYTEFNIYGMNYGSCGLPTECYCPSQTNLKINSLERPTVEVDANTSRFFTYVDEHLEVEVTVMTTTVSYSPRCKRQDGDTDQESTFISWRRTFSGNENVAINEPKIFTGFLSDVKFFRLGQSIYIIMAFYFHPNKNETNNLYTEVYELDVNHKTVGKVDEIPSSGAQVLEVFWTTKGVILVIGNSFDSDRFTDSVNSAIYRFNEYENKFELLRYIKTHGILSIKSMRYDKTSFIFFVQKQTWPLLILKYNQDYDNYYFSQKLDTEHSLVRSNFLSVCVISTTTPGYSGDLFVGIVLTDDSFRLFKYKHIEGFVEESYQEQNNVRVLHPFWIGSTQYLLASSASDTSKIYSFVEQGR